MMNTVITVMLVVAFAVVLRDGEYKCSVGEYKQGKAGQRAGKYDRRETRIHRENLPCISASAGGPASSS